MKYSVEYRDGKFIETLEINGNTGIRTWKREKGSDISGLCSKELDFSEQFEPVEDEEVLEYINDLFDNSMLVADIEDFIINTGVE